MRATGPSCTARGSRSSTATGPASRVRRSSRSRARCSSTKATTATSWRRKSTSSRTSSATRWPITSTWRKRASASPISASIWRKSRASPSPPCGTAYYAGLIAKYWIEQYARLPVEIDVASEFRYREPPLVKDGLALFVSQSGETADTLATLRYCKAGGQRIASVVNVRTSTIARESDAVLPTLAGPEIGVASTESPSPASLRHLPVSPSPSAVPRGAISAEKEQELVEGSDRGAAADLDHAARREASMRNWPSRCRMLATCSISVAALAIPWRSKGA